MRVTFKSKLVSDDLFRVAFFAENKACGNTSCPDGKNPKCNNTTNCANTGCNPGTNIFC